MGDSTLPPSPRANFEQECGHISSKERRPYVNSNMVPNPPPTDVQPSDRQLSPRGWFFERPGASSGSSFKRTNTAGVSTAPSAGFEAAYEYRRRARAKLAARNARREKEWDPTPHRVMPPFLSGIKAVTEEPWSRDARVYAHKFGSFERMANQQMDGSRLEEYNDESILDSTNGYEVKVTATGLANKKGQPTWDSSTYRPCPFVLRGIRPVTREPWVFDERIYNRDTTPGNRAAASCRACGGVSAPTGGDTRDADTYKRKPRVNLNGNVKRKKRAARGETAPHRRLSHELARAAARRARAPRRPPSPSRRRASALADD